MRTIRNGDGLRPRRYFVYSIANKHAEVKVHMDKLLKGTLGAVTTDGWTSASGDAYYGFTYHWIDTKWVLHSFPIGITHHKGTTTGLDHAMG